MWLAEAGRKVRPVLILTRPEVIAVRQLVTVAEITTAIRGLAAEVEFDHEAVRLERPSVINCDVLHTIARSSLTQQLGSLGDDTMRKVCWAVGYALGC